MYESLSLLLKIQNLPKGKKQKIIENILAVIFIFYSGNKSIINTLDISGYNIPCKNSEKLQKCFSETDAFNLDILDISLLYDYIKYLFVVV